MKPAVVSVRIFCTGFKRRRVAWAVRLALSLNSWRRAPGPGAGWGKAAGQRSSACPQGRARATSPRVPMQPDVVLALTLWLVCAARAQARGVTWSVDRVGIGRKRSMTCRVKMRVPHDIRMFVLICMMHVMRAGPVGVSLHVCLFRPLLPGWEVVRKAGGMQEGGPPAVRGQPSPLYGPVQRSQCCETAHG